MNTLLELQSCFSRSVINQSDEIQAWLVKTDKPGLEIYNHAYQIRLIEVLSLDFPVLKQLLGDDEFEVMGSEFTREFPSCSFSLRTFGKNLSQFLDSDSKYSKYPYLAELAAFEWFLTDVFDVADTPVADVEAMSSLQPTAWPGLTAKLHNSIKWLSLKWNIEALYTALKTNTTMPDIIEHPERICCLIWRQNYSPHYRFLDNDEWLALKTFETHEFSKLCLILSQTHENAALQAATYLKSWLSAGLIESIEYSNNEE